MKGTVHCSAIVLAAGKGSRMQSKVHKQFMLLDGKPLIYYALKCFSDSPFIQEIILVTGEDEIDYCKREIVDRFSFSKVHKIVAGGKERYESVANALRAVTDAEYVMIHDGARPFVTQDMIARSLETVQETKACTVGVPSKDTMKKVDANGFGIETPNRKFIWNVQTPQTFSYAMLFDAYEKMMAEDVNDITDDTMIMERYQGCPSKLILGDYKNIKITTPEDLVIAEAFLNTKG